LPEIGSVLLKVRSERYSQERISVSLCRACWMDPNECRSVMEFVISTGKHNVILHFLQ